MKELNELSDILTKIENIKTTINKAILELPDNPKIKRISEHPRCFIMSSKDVFDPNMRIKNNWNVFYHDFKAQYKKIAEVVNRARPENIIPQLNAIISNGRLKSKDQCDCCFHPTVIAHLKSIL